MAFSFQTRSWLFSECFLRLFPAINTVLVAVQIISFLNSFKNETAPFFIYIYVNLEVAFARKKHQKIGSFKEVAYGKIKYCKIVSYA